MDVATSILAHKIDTGSCKIAIWTDHDKPFAPSTLRIEINSLKDFHLVHTNAIVALKKVAPNGIKVRRRFKQYYFGMPDY